MEHDLSPERAEPRLRAGLAALDLPTEAAPRLAALAARVAQRAERLNLTAHRGVEAIAERLVLEALALGCALPERAPPSIADLGSGSGFPGLPLAIVWPETRVTLVEARERRYHFQREAIRSIGIANATALRGRAEELPPEPHRVVVAQAMAEPAVALGWMTRWATPEGWLALPQSSPPAPIEPPPGVRWIETRSYGVPGGQMRALWLGKLDPAAAV